MTQRLRPGMSAQEVISQFGEPGGEVRQRRDSYLFRYRAPIGQLNVEKEGYVGFEIEIIGGKVKDWRALRGTPSFERWPKPALPRWTSTLWLLILGSSILYGAVRAFDRGLNEKLAIQKAYQAREIPRQKLPADFHFITHASTIQEVTNNDAVILLPESPFKPENQIAAVYYRPTRLDDGA